MLTLVPTPIGNLEDITLRALRVLREADLIACEDTRTSSILLKHYGINRPLTSFHLHNENEKTPVLLERLRNGENIAVISDAGTPGISDPGWILLKRAVDEGLDVDVLPGATAVIPAVVMSGLETRTFMFAGFPPEKSGERTGVFESLSKFQSTLCFYLSPHKAEKHIAGMIDVFGNRKAALVREVSKVFQEVIRSDLAGILERVRDGVKGELVLVVDGNAEKVSYDWKHEAEQRLRDGETVRDIVRSMESRVSKNALKKFLLSKEMQAVHQPASESSSL